MTKTSMRPAAAGVHGEVGRDERGEVVAGTMRLGGRSRGARTDSSSYK